MHIWQAGKKEEATHKWDADKLSKKMQKQVFIRLSNQNASMDQAENLIKFKF